MAMNERQGNGNSRKTSLSETLWQLPRSRWLRRKILLLPIFESLIERADLPDGAEELFVQQSSIQLKSLKEICTGKSHEILATVAGVLEDELQLLSSLYDVSKTPLSQLAVNAYVAYVDQVTSLTAPCGMCEVHSLMAVALHVRLNLWVSNVLLQTSPEVGKAASKATKVGRWLEFCSTRYEKLSLQIDEAFDALVAGSRLSSAQLSTVGDAYLQLVQHEHQVYSQIAGSQADSANAAKTLLQMAKIIPPRVLIIAGSDSGGGAGLQADLKSCTVQGAFATTAVTAVTAQNTHGVQGIFPIPIDFLKKQVDSVLSDIGTDVVKTGMLATSEIVKAVAACLKASQSAFGSCLVVDPVMVSTSGHTLLEDDAIQSLKDELFPCATLITPNLPEARLLLGVKDIESVAAMETAARQLAAMGPRWVLVKGGHLPGSDQEATDILCNGATGECIQFKSKLVANTNHTHGTGCTLASSIAAHLARGLQVPQAV